MSGQYHNALYTGDVEERIKILKSLGQGKPGVLLNYLNLTGRILLMLMGSEIKS